jgi:DNA-binding MurR/RpiR family transcriptional regulator
MKAPFRLRGYNFLQQHIQHRKYLMANRRSYNGLTEYALGCFQEKLMRINSNQAMANFLSGNEAFIRQILHPLHQKTHNELTDLITEADLIIHPPTPEQLKLF